MKLIFNSKRCPGSVVVYAVDSDEHTERKSNDVCFIAILYKDRNTSKWELIELCSDITMQQSGNRIVRDTYKELKNQFIEHYQKYTMKEISEAAAKGFDQRREKRLKD